jgi:hypothetical protein
MARWPASARKRGRADIRDYEWIEEGKPYREWLPWRPPRRAIRVEVGFAVPFQHVRDACGVPAADCILMLVLLIIFMVAAPLA